MKDLGEWVVAAQGGDKEAFTQIVRRFQDMAYGVAYAMLGDAGSAQDAAQEAFIEAYLSLAQLREPAAFPGWFRRVVIKHSDREMRNRRLTVPLDDSMGLAASETDPDDAIETLQTRRTVQEAIAKLPPMQRQIVTLFYLRDYSQKEIEEFLELPVSAIKKHLFTARKKLKGRLERMVETQIQSNRPSQSDAFANETEFLLALRTGDLDGFKAMVELHPELLEKRFETRATRERHYWPIGGAVLHWAAVTGDEALLAFLRSRKVDVNAADRYGMTPLHTAVWMRQRAVSRQLLAAGADPNAVTREGHTALHLAAMRNYDGAAEELLASGARTDVRDKNGRTPMDWAVTNNAASVVERLAGHGAPPTAARGGRMPEINLSAANSFLETGIKAVDLFVPIVRGGRNGLLTPHVGVGALVVLGELMHRMDALYGARAVSLGCDDERFTSRDLQLFFREAGVSDLASVIFAGGTDSEEQRLRATRQAVMKAKEIRSEGREVFFLVQGRMAFSAASAAELNASIRSDSGITVVYWGDETAGAEPEPLENLDAVITFNVNRARQQLYPAIDLIYSRSRLLTDGAAGESHRKIALRARRLLRRHQDLCPIIESRGLDLLPNAEDRKIVERARRLDRFMTQPFHWTSPWTGVPGEHVPLSETLEGCRAILEGECDEMPEESFFFVGNLTAAREKARGGKTNGTLRKT